MRPVFALALSCLKNGNGQRDQTHAARSQAILLKYSSVSVIAFSAAVSYNEKENGMQCSPPTSFTGVSMSSIVICRRNIHIGNKRPRSRTSDEGHDLAALCESIRCLMLSCNGAKLMDEKVFKHNVGHKELAAWVDGLKL